MFAIQILSPNMFAIISNNNFIANMIQNSYQVILIRIPYCTCFASHRKRKRLDSVQYSTTIWLLLFGKWLSTQLWEKIVTELVASVIQFPSHHCSNLSKYCNDSCTTKSLGEILGEIFWVLIQVIFTWFIAFILTSLVH